MDNEKLLNELEEYLANHGCVQGIPFSEEGMLQRVKTVREEVKRQAGAKEEEQSE